MTDKWDEQIESDIKAGKLDGFANEAMQRYQDIVDYDFGKKRVATDLERFVELYKSFGVECVVNPSLAEDRQIIRFTTEGHDEPYNFGNFVHFLDTCSSKVEVGSLEFEFTLSGKFIGMAGSEIE